MNHVESFTCAGVSETVWQTAPETNPHLPALYRGDTKTGADSLEYREDDEFVMEKRLADF